MLSIRNYFLTVLFAAFAGGLFADSVWLKDFQASYKLENFLLLVEDEEVKLDIETVSRKDFFGFRPFENWDQELKANVVYWAKIEIGNQLPEAEEYTEWVLRFTTSITDITCYQEVSPGVFEIFYSGAHQPKSRKSFAPTSDGNFFKVSLPPGEMQTFYFMAIAEREAMPPEFEISMQHVTHFFNDLRNEKRDSSLFLGFVLMMLLYNLVIFVFVKDRAYLYYSFYLFYLSVYVAYKNGDLGDMLEPMLFPDHPEYITFAKLSVHLTIVCYLAFIRKFSNLKVLLPKWDKVFQVVIWLVIPFLAMDIYLMLTSNFSYNISDRSMITYTFIFLAVIFLLTRPLSRVKDKSNRFILAGITFLGVGVLLTLIARLQSYDFTLIWFKAGIILDIMAFSLGLAYRQVENEKEKQVTLFQLEKNQILQAQEHAEAMRQREIQNMQARFYTNITHEFRTPLAVIQGVISEVQGNDMAREIILRNVDNLLYKIHQLLDLAKLDVEKLELNLTKADIIAYLKYLFESFYPLASAKNIQLSFHSEVTELEMYFDEEKLSHVVSNILSNALKFTMDGGLIQVQASKTMIKNQPMLKLLFSDNGIGINEKDIPFIFDRFYQADNQALASRRGTGIGLSLTRELVRLMDGDITVESSQGKGSRFVVILPLEMKERNGVPVPDENLTLNADSLFVPQEGSVIINQKNPQVVEESHAVEDEAPLLLLIEDSPDLAMYLESLLYSTYRVEVAQNGEEGIELAIELIPDIIITDVMMPKKDGYEVCRFLKADERTNHIPIVMVTAKSTHDDKIAGLKVGADAYLVKPFNKEELFVWLEKLMALRRTLQERYSNPKLPKDLQVEISVSNKLDDQLLRRVHDYIYDNMENPDLSVKEICREMNLGQTQLYRKIKALTGESTIQFIRKIKLKKAIELLQTSDMNISEVAYKVGFNDPNYFSRLFQQEFDLPPSAFRK